MNRIFLTPLLFAFVFHSAFAQTEFNHTGIKLFREGKFRQAIKVLEASRDDAQHKASSAFWNYLGLSYIGNAEPKKAIPVLTKATSLSPLDTKIRMNLASSFFIDNRWDEAIAEANAVIKIDPQDLSAYRLKADSFLWQGRFDLAEQVGKQMVERQPNAQEGYKVLLDSCTTQLALKFRAGSEVIEEVDLLRKTEKVLERAASATSFSEGNGVFGRRLQSIRAIIEVLEKADANQSLSGLSRRRNATPFRVIKKPKARYTEAAKRAGISGIVQFLVLFGPERTVKHYLPLNRLGNGLDEMAEAALNQVEFELSIVDGKPIPAVIAIHYGFSIN